MSKEFGEMLAILRERAGFESQLQLSRQSGVNNSTIARLERGETTPAPETLQKLAPCLKVPYEQLMRYAGHLAAPEKEPEKETTHPKAKRIIDSLARANGLEDSDYELIARQMEQLIDYVQSKKAHPKRSKEKQGH